LEIVSQKQLKREFCDPREGDPISVVGDNSRARHQLGWEPKKSIQEIMSDSWSAQIAK
jgi:UDP-glucose 4-epimerase